MFCVIGYSRLIKDGLQVVLDDLRFALTGRRLVGQQVDTHVGVGQVVFVTWDEVTDREKYDSLYTCIYIYLYIYLSYIVIHVGVG